MIQKLEKKNRKNIYQTKLNLFQLTSLLFLTSLCLKRLFLGNGTIPEETSSSYATGDERSCVHISLPKWVQPKEVNIWTECWLVYNLSGHLTAFIFIPVTSLWLSFCSQISAITLVWDFGGLKIQRITYQTLSGIEEQSPGFIHLYPLCFHSPPPKNNTGIPSLTKILKTTMKLRLVCKQ